MSGNINNSSGPRAEAGNGGDEIPTRTSNKGNIVGASFFGFLFACLIIYVVVFMNCVDAGKLRIIEFSCALLAGLVGGFMSGELGLKWAPDSPVGRVVIRGLGGMALFIATLIWWLTIPPVSPCQPYRVRVNVVTEQNVPVSDFEIWNSIDNTPSQKSIYWEFEVPEAKKPADGKITVYAIKKSAYLSGQTVVELASNYNQIVALVLKKDTSARIKGQIQDAGGKLVQGARVVAYGHETEATTTGSDGRFDLPAHAASGERVQIYAVKDNYDSREWFPAGDTDAVVTLRARR